MSNGAMLNFNNLAKGALEANELIKGDGVDANWIAQQLQMGQRYENQNSVAQSANYEGYKPVYNMNGFTPTEEPAVVQDVPKEPTVDNLGGMGGNLRSPSNLVTADTTNYNLGQQNQPATAAGANGGVSEEKKNEIERTVDSTFSIPALLAKLQELGSLQPGGEELFQLDTVYKGSSPMYGIEATPAEHPTVDFVAQHNYNIGNPIKGDE